MKIKLWLVVGLGLLAGLARAADGRMSPAEMVAALTNNDPVIVERGMAAWRLRVMDRDEENIEYGARFGAKFAAQLISIRQARGEDYTEAEVVAAVTNMIHESVAAGTNTAAVEEIVRRFWAPKPVAVALTVCSNGVGTAVIWTTNF